MTSYAVLNLKEEDLIKVNNSNKVENSVISVVGVGTGMGTSIVVPIKNENN